MQDLKPEIFPISTGAFDSSLVHGINASALRLDRLARFRKLASSLKHDHAWSRMEDRAILHDAGFLARDPETGEEGVTVSGLLVLGSDAVIREVLPGARIEIKAQTFDLHGYDEQHLIHTNALRAYQWLLAFLRRALPENGEAEENLQVPCLRDRIFPELVTNLIVHRDYAAASGSRVILERDRIILENPSRSGHQGIIELAWSVSRPKNPTLYRFFSEIGLIPSPGSGLDSLEKHGEAYFGISPLVFDRDFFRVFAPCNLLDGNVLPNGQLGMQAISHTASHVSSTVQDNQESDRGSRVAMQAHRGRPRRDGGEKSLHVTGHSMQDGAPGQSASIQTRHIVQERGLHAQVPFGQESQKTGKQGAPVKAVQEDRVAKMLEFCRIPRNREEIQRHMGFNNRDYFRKEILLPLLQTGLIEATIPDKPNRPNQQYRTAASPGSAA
jgi:hypothetical protein